MPLELQHVPSDQMPFPAFWDWNAGSFGLISDGLKAMFGIAQFPSPGDFWKLILSQEDFERFQKELRRIVATPGSSLLSIEVDGRHKLGHLVTANIVAEVITRGADGTAERISGCVIPLRPNELEGLLSAEDLLGRLSEQFPGALFQYQYLSNGITRFPYASKGIWNVYELTPEEVRSNASRVFDRIHGDDLEQVFRSLHDSYTSLKPWEQDYRVVLPSKGLRWLRSSAKPVQMPDDGVVWHGYITDITLRKNTENELIKVNADLQAILNSGSHVSIIGTDSTGAITHFSKGSENLLGYSAEEVIGIKTPELFHLPEEIALRASQLNARLDTAIAGFDALVEMAKRGKYDSREWAYMKKDGSCFPAQLVVTPMLDIEGVITGFLMIGTDISQIKKAEQALIESEQRWQFALEGAGDGVWDWNLEKHSIYISPKSKAILGYQDDDIPNVAHGWQSLIHPDDREKYTEFLDLHLKNKTDIYLNEYRALCKNGEYKWLMDRGKVVKRDDNQRPLRIIGTHSDISRVKIKENELRQTIGIIGEQNRRLLNFAHIVSHNLRSHSSNFEMMFRLLEDADTAEEKEEMLGHIKTISVKLSETITHLNEVVMVQTAIEQQRKNIRLHDYINKTQKVLTANIVSKNALVINNVPKDQTVSYNPAYLESILLNLLSNAIKYTHPDRRPEIEFTLASEDSKPVLTIKDNGLGINLNLHKEKIFGMYQTFHSNKDAKGIGLFITKNQVEAMGGKIELESEVNKGSTFKIYL